MNKMHTNTVVNEVRHERMCQDIKWGQQDWPDVSRGATSRADYGAKAEHWKFVNDQLAENGTIGWDSILLEEVFEALAEEDPTMLRTELIQVAAVAVAWVEAVDRRTGAVGAAA